MNKPAPPKQRAMQAVVILVILSAWLLIGVSAFVEVAERRAGTAVLMIGQGLLVTGFGLAILRALQTGFGALDRFFGAILQRTERPGAAGGESSSLEAQALGLGSAPPVRHLDELAQARPAVQRAAAASSFSTTAAPNAEAQREAAQQRVLAARSAAPQRALSAKPTPTSSPSRPVAAKAPAAKAARPAEKAPARAVSAARPATSSLSQPVPHTRPAAPAPAPAPARATSASASPKPPPHAIEEGFLGDRAYRILSDGTVEVETLLGVRAFESLDVAREFIGAPRLRPEGPANEAYSSAA